MASKKATDEVITMANQTKPRTLGCVNHHRTSTWPPSRCATGPLTMMPRPGGSGIIVGCRSPGGPPHSRHVRPLRQRESGERPEPVPLVESDVDRVAGLEVGGHVVLVDHHQGV